MKRLFFFLFLSLSFSSCGPYTPRNADLTVEYNGKTVYSAEGESPRWSNEASLRKAMTEPGNKYIIFGADWCKNCNLLRKAIKQANIKDKIIFLNIDTPWVVSLASAYRLKTVPTMMEVDQNTKIVASKVGAGQIIVHMLLRYRRRTKKCV